MAQFWSRVDKSGDCWVWIATVHHTGYGAFSFSGNSRYAHRFSWIISHGDIPPGMCVCHRCDNPLCVRPDHLFLGTITENIHDRDAKGRGARAARKVSDQQVSEIRLRFALGNVSRRELAIEYDVSQDIVGNIIRGRTFKGVRE